MERHLVDRIWERAGSRCDSCKLPQEYSLFTFEIDHVIPKKHGGRTVLDNLCFACW